jgi:hypothetical protein
MSVAGYAGAALEGLSIGAFISAMTAAGAVAVVAANTESLNNYRTELFSNYRDAGEMFAWCGTAQSIVTEYLQTDGTYMRHVVSYANGAIFSVNDYYGVTPSYPENRGDNLPWTCSEDGCSSWFKTYNSTMRTKRFGNAWFGRPLRVVFEGFKDRVINGTNCGVTEEPYLWADTYSKWTFIGALSSSSYPLPGGNNFMCPDTYYTATWLGVW